MRRVFFAVFYLTGLLLAQSFERPVPYDITSDFGPRNLAGAYDWHWGIDYGAPMWTSVEAVEGGTITLINYEEGGAGWYIRVDGDSAYWTYMHLYEDGANPRSPDNRYEARIATLVNPNNPQQTSGSYVFIFWHDRNNNRAEKILVPYRSGNLVIHNWWVRARPGDPGYDPNNPYILNQSGQRILTHGEVANREIVGPSGCSGGVPIHLHVSAKSTEGGRAYDINPLYYINHPRPNYALTIHHPPADAILYHRLNAPEAQQENERIRVNINSAQSYDLDRGFVYFFNPGEARVFDDAHRFAKITYGGPPPDRDWPNPYPQRITNDGETYRGSFIQTGIDPQGNMPGSDDFYFIGGLSEGGFQFNTKINLQGTGGARINSEARFSDGRKDMVIRAHSIRWNFQDYYFDTERQVTLDNFKPYVTRVRIDQQDRTVKYESHWPTTPLNDYDLGQLIVDKDDDCKVGKLLTFVIEFSEDMKTDVMPTLQVQFPSRCSTTFNLSIDIRNNLDNILWLINNKEV